MYQRLSTAVLHLRRRIAYKIGLDWGMPTLGFLIDHDRHRFETYNYLDELFVRNPDTYREEVAVLTGDRGASWG